MNLKFQSSYSSPWGGHECALKVHDNPFNSWKSECHRSLYNAPSGDLKYLWGPFMAIHSLFLFGLKWWNNPSVCALFSRHIYSWSLKLQHHFSSSTYTDSLPGVSAANSNTAAPIQISRHKRTHKHRSTWTRSIASLQGWRLWSVGWIWM